MKDKVRIVFVMLPLLAVTALHAQDPRPLNLNEAIELSIKNSKQLKVSGAKMEEAEAALTEARQRQLPDASVSGSYLKLTSPTVDLKKQQSNSGGNGGSAPQVSQAMYGILNASLPLYSGGRIRYGIESSRYLAQAARLDAEFNREEMVGNTVQAYVNLYKARAAVDLMRENLAQAQQRVADFKNLEKNGLLARNDLLKAELQASNIELSLLDAENNWQLANLNMNLMLGLPEKTVLMPDSSLFQENISVKNLDDYLQSANARKDLEALGLRKNAAQSGIKSLKGEKYPSIALTGGYIAANIPSVLTITNAANIGLGVSYNIASLWKNKARVQGAEARVRELEATQSLMNDQIRLQVNRAYLNWLSSQKKIEVYAKAIEQAAENYRITKNKYQNSLATTTDLLEADVAQLQARMNHVFAKADAISVYHQLLMASGQAANGTH